MARRAPMSLDDHFGRLPNPRARRTRRRALVDILVTTVCAVICGADDWVAIARFGRAKRTWFRQFLALPHGIPSHDTFGRVFAALDPHAFHMAFLAWVESMATLLPGDVMAIDAWTCLCDRIIGARDCRSLRQSTHRQESTSPGVIGDPAVHDDDEEEDEGRFRRRRTAPAPVRRGFLSRLGAWLVGAVITGIVPLAVSLWIHSLIADYVPILKRATVAGAAGGAAVVAASFSLVLFLELYIYWKFGPSAGGDDDVPFRGRRQFVFIYVLVPLVPGLVVGYLTLSPATRLSQAIDWIRQPSAVQVERQVGQAIQEAAAGETRVAGLRALTQFGSPDALSELARLAKGDPRLLKDPSSFDALASALASFGSQSEPLLQAIWKESGHAGVGSTPAEGRTPADLVLAAYNKLNPIADTAVAYGIAHEAAVAPSSGPERRAAAIAVIAKSGSRSAFPFLASFLVNQPEPVKQAALEALRHLDARLRKQEAPPVAAAPVPVGR